MDEQWLNIQQAAAHFGVSENAIRLRIKRRKYANTEMRDGRVYILITSEPTPDQALVTSTGQPTNEQLERWITALEHNNALLEQQIALLTKKRRWPWQHDP